MGNCEQLALCVFAEVAWILYIFSNHLIGMSPDQKPKALFQRRGIGCLQNQKSTRTQKAIYELKDKGRSRVEMFEDFCHNDQIRRWNFDPSLRVLSIVQIEMKVAVLIKRYPLWEVSTATLW
jgi:hypothetical protein